MSLALRNFLFTVVVPGSGGVLIPWWLLTRGDAQQNRGPGTRSR
jgi:hypothetical protein